MSEENDILPMPESVDELATPSGVPGEEITFKIQFGKGSTNVTKPSTTTIGQLKTLIAESLGIPPNMQKLMLKGLLKNDDHTLLEAGIKAGSKVMLIGTSPSQVPDVKQLDKPDMDNAGSEVKEEPLSQQPQHAKVLAKGLPEDAMPGIANKQVPLQDSQTYIPGLLNAQGNKVRLTFKPELEQLWIGSNTSTQKVPYSTITKIEATAITGREEYSMVSLQIGAAATSRYWLYYVPSQYVAAIKIRVLGLLSLMDP